MLTLLPVVRRGVRGRREGRPGAGRPGGRTLVGSLAMPSMFLFPLGVVYLAFGLVRHAALRLSDHDDAIPLGVQYWLSLVKQELGSVGG